MCDKLNINSTTKLFQRVLVQLFLRVIWYFRIITNLWAEMIFDPQIFKFRFSLLVLVTFCFFPPFLRSSLCLESSSNFCFWLKFKILKKGMLSCFCSAFLTVLSSPMTAGTISWSSNGSTQGLTVTLFFLYVFLFFWDGWDGWDVWDGWYWWDG